jgi:5,6-dimethylbenzimidazole synthase
MFSDDSADSAEVRFTVSERETLHAVLFQRRDMRHFIPGQVVAPEVMARLLAAAHAAPSVGLMQPWRLLRIEDPAQRVRIAALVEEERLATADCMGERSDAFMALKVEGVREAAAFGRRTMPRDMALCSVACAIQNLWLAARAENLGMGWVSLFDPSRLGEVLGLPAEAQAVAVLCIGPVPAFYPQPMLEMTGWRQGRSQAETVFFDRWPAA